jgi:hypothetical protein
MELMTVRRIAVVDHDTAAPPPDVDVVLALEGAEVTACGPLVLHPSSPAAAAAFVVASPARISLALDDPLPFLSLVADLRRSAALRAA